MAIRTIVALLLALAICATLAPAHADPIAPGAVRVVDGDTIAVGAVRYRLVGFDTPEKGARARCRAERTLAARATRKLRRIVSGGGLDLSAVPCSCRPGTAGTRACNFARPCGVLTADGRDVGITLIAAGLARPYPFDWRHRPAPAHWCGR
ncbi:thermonuclease family protein [Xanthobacter sp. VTT E-85241]|uniref:thermonuclease family protein n=1 Tax=Roseixanthobacter finlandensis TaxID=3119922 RepID=UPI003729C314